MAERRPPADPDRFDEAVSAFRKRVPLPDPEFRELSDEERKRAFWVAGVAQGRLVQEVMDAADRAIRDGTTLEDFKGEIGTKLAEAWGGEDPARIETVFRTNVLSSYNAGRHEIMNRPAVKAARPYVRFDAVGDSRTDDACDVLDGIVLPADDPFWKNHTPPLHHQCRCTLVPLSVEEAREEGIEDESPDVETPSDGFGRPPDPADWKPDLESFSPELRAILKERLGL